MLDKIGSNIEQYMTALSVRQKLVASNIANADTPGYKTKDVDFADALNEAAGGEPHIVEPSGLVTKNDGNNVSLDRESRLLAENALRFNVASNLLRSQIRSIKTAMQEGQS